MERRSWPKRIFSASALVRLTPPPVSRSTKAQLRSRFQFADNICQPANVLGVSNNIINGPNVDTSGVDFSASYNWPDAFMGGDAQFGIEGTYTIGYERGALVTLDGFTIAAPINRAGKSELLSAFYSYPRTRANLWAQWNRDGHNIRWTTHFKDGPINVVGASLLHTKDEITHDLVYTGQLPWDTTVTAGIINLFDKDPPFTRSQYNYDYTNAYFLGRTIQLGTGRAESIAELFVLAARLTDSAAVPVEDPSRMRPDGSEVLVLQSDPSLAHQLLGWQAVTSLEDGLARTIDWIRANPEAEIDRVQL